MKLFLLFCLLLFSSFNINAASRVIQDNRLDSLGITPSLGRGYSISTNTYQSQCISTVRTTLPSYDLTYSFKEIDVDWKTSFKTSSRVDVSFSHLFISGNVSFTTEQEGSDTYHYHHMFVEVGVNSYYYSMDEANSLMSSSARDLLTKGDVVGFFSSCGPYYIRSIGRHSKFLAILRYKTTSQTRDYKFERKVKAHLKGLFGSSSGNVSSDTTSEFHQEISTKQLSIVVWAQGLGKNELADIIPTDIDSFKSSVKQAIRTMQDPDSGRVTSIEVVPWVENTEFQNLVEPESKKDKLNIKKKLTILANSELVAELSRIDRDLLDQYQKASLCRNTLKENFSDVTAIDSDSHIYDKEKVFFRDLTRPSLQTAEINLKKFEEILSADNVSAYLIANNKFNYGTDNVPDDSVELTTGAVHCINQIHDGGIDKVHFSNFKACNLARGKNVPQSIFLDKYCLPSLARVKP